MSDPDLDSLKDVPASEASVALDLRPKSELSNLVMDRKFQLRYTAMIVGICTALTGGLGYLIYYFQREASLVVGVRALDPADVEAVALQKELMRSDRMMLLALVIFCVVLIAAITAGALRVTQSIARPLFKINFHLNEIANGRLSPLGQPHKGDHLADLSATFRRMHQSLADRARVESAALGEAIEEAEKAGATGVAFRLRRMKRDREQFLS